MLLNIVRWLFGYVSFEIIGKYPERFINIVIRKGISIFNTIYENEKMFACMYVKDYKNVRDIAKKSKVRLKICDRIGLPFYLKKYKSRVGVLGGIAVFALIVYILSSFVWTIDVIGLETISQAHLMDVLREKGLYVGTYKKNVSFMNISRTTMIDIEDIAWMSVNVQGSHASVEIKEKHKSPFVDDYHKPANVKAKCDGVILSINTTQGEAHFEKGSAVVKDQMIVSGVLEDELGGVSVVRADAQVIAKTTHKKTFTLDKEQNEFAFSSPKKRVSVSVFNLKIPCVMSFADSKNCAMRYRTRSMKAFDTVLPLTSYTVSMYEKSVSTQKLSAKSAEKILLNQSVLYETFELNKCKIINRKSKFKDDGERYVMDVIYTCEEDIAYQQDIDVSNAEIERILPTKEKSQ